MKAADLKVGSIIATSIDGFTVEEMEQCWNYAQYEMHKSFSSSYVPVTFEKYLKEIKEKKEQINRLVP